MKKISTLVIFVSLFFIALTVNAELKVASVLGNNMVLQRNTEVKLWGKATPAKSLKISTGWSTTVFTTVADEKGDWMLKVKTADAGGPYTIRIEMGKEKLQLDNILLGEVWLCSGQSNMEIGRAHV